MPKDDQPKPSSPAPTPPPPPATPPPPAPPIVPGPIGPFIPPYRGPGRMINATPPAQWIAGRNRGPAR
ncbi:hypothetical protein ACIG87_02315 [Micromonospora sp. NPDC051925]|uniref:hypothetical protein n=1 Tax=Micromonospora sp. NPDC051925 TaxID=3364288 RepID=UPI0037C80BB6